MRHPEFEKIHSDFLAHYSNDPATGENRYSSWVKALGLDESKSYREQAASRLGLKESFRWAQFLLQFVKEDADARYYKVEALFPVETLKGDVFTSEELLQAARTLTGKPSNLNHDWEQMLSEIEIMAAQYEDDAVECLVRILKSSPVCSMIDRGEIVNVSIEGDWTHGQGKGLVLSGLGWLTKDVLPGVPLTRIMPVERVTQSALVETASKLAEANQAIEDLKKQQQSSLLKDPPKMMPISEVIEILLSLLPATVVERSAGLGMQLLCQQIRAHIFKLKERLGAK